MATARHGLDLRLYAALREARRVLEDEHGGRLDDSQLVAALANVVLGEKRERAQTQLSVTVCERCKQGWQGGVPISAAAVERATCDAEHIGSVDAETPERAHQDVSPATARLVWARDQSRCQVPGCRSSRGLEIHHIVHREHGGGHEPANLMLICSSCHIAHHDGRLTIRGTAGAIEVERSHVGLKSSAAHVEAKQALVALGWKRRTAAIAVDQAIGELGDAPLEQVIRSALRHCWQPEAFAPS